jgi:hypothetical protein
MILSLLLEPPLEGAKRDFGFDSPLSPFLTTLVDDVMLANFELR